MAKSQQKIEKIRHSLAHIMAAAVSQLYPGVKFGIGPAIANGFYYDFDFSNVILKAVRPEGSLTNARNNSAGRPAASREILRSTQNDKTKITPEDLPKIEEKMQRLIKQSLEFKKKEIPKKEAAALFKDQLYKLELVKELSPTLTLPLDYKRKGITIYQSGNFIDLCAGPHIKSTKEINPKAFKLTKIAGAYWRGDEKNPMLTRIYGAAFETEKELKDYLRQVEEAGKRDHRKLGLKLDLFSFHDEAPGMAFWHPKGLFIYNQLIKYWRQEHKKAGYQEVATPILLKEYLWQTSGHMETYKENMYFSKIDEQKHVIKPMNCPGGLLLYKEKPHSYRELPLRVAELGLVHRHEMAGVLHGLFRVRSFTQDDAHIYCTKEQVESEIKEVIDLTLKIYKTFGFDQIHLELSTRPKKYVGALKMWNLAEKILEKVLKDLKLDFQINPGDGAFYGPKIDFHLADSIGRTWQCGTCQLDFAQPENFELEYIDRKGRPQRPVMIHRTIYGSLERFIGILIEHYEGALPLWLAPEQIWVMSIGKAHQKYAREIVKKISVGTGRRPVPTHVKLIDSNETIGKKIRESQIQKIPYVLVVGDKEIKSKTVAVRHLSRGGLGIMPVEKFLENVKIEINKKS